jgi:hypothetical protein
VQRLAISSLLTLILAASAAAAPPVTFSDGDFQDADWASVFTASFEGPAMTPLAGGSASATRQVSGSNAFRAITHTVPAAPASDAFAAVWSAHFRSGFTYDPGVQGRIGSIDYSELAQAVSHVNLGQSAGLAIRQGGQVFVVQVGVTPDATFTLKERKGIKANDFGVMTAGGFPGGAKPDFAAPGPIEFGFVRGNSTNIGGTSGFTLTAAIDDWSVRLNPPCLSPAECDDEDACTTDTCVDGACVFTPLPCDDGDTCTTDACAAGLCQHVDVDCDDGADCTQDECRDGACQHLVTATFELVDAKLQSLLDILESKACADDTLTKKFAKKLAKKLRKARAKIGHADDATRAQAVSNLLAKANVLLDLGTSIVSNAVASSSISAACGDALQDFLADIRQCVQGLPQQP